MQTLYLPTLLRLSKEIGRLTLHLKGEPADNNREQHRKTDVSALRSYAKSFAELGLPMCEMQVKNMVRASSNKSDLIKNSEFANMLDELFNRLSDECELKKFIALSDTEAKYYLPEEPLFGEEVEDIL